MNKTTNHLQEISLVRTVWQSIKMEYPSVKSIKLKYCKEADEEHLADGRQYMHTDHHKKTICFAFATEALPVKHIRGLIWHEIGHILMDKIDSDHDEWEADREVKRKFGVKVKYSSSRYGRHLQYV